MASRAFRFHLSTAILLMFAIGGLIGLNFYQRFERLGESSSGSGDCCLGFPINAWIEHGDVFFVSFTESDIRGRFPNIDNENQPWGVKFIRGNRGFFLPSQFGIFIPFGVAIDTAFAIAVVLFVALISEYMIQRKLKRSAQ